MANWVHVQQFTSSEVVPAYRQLILPGSISPPKVIIPLIVISEVCRAPKEPEALIPSSDAAVGVAWRRRIGPSQVEGAHVLVTVAQAVNAIRSKRALKAKLGGRISPR